LCIAIQTWRPNAALRHVRIIALTGDEEKAQQARCDDYLSKPIDEDLLFEKRRHCLGDSGSDEE